MIQLYIGSSSGCNRRGVIIYLRNTGNCAFNNALKIRRIYIKRFRE